MFCCEMQATSSNVPDYNFPTNDIRQEEAVSFIEQVKGRSTMGTPSPQRLQDVESPSNIDRKYCV